MWRPGPRTLRRSEMTLCCHQVSTVGSYTQSAVLCRLLVTHAARHSVPTLSRSVFSSSLWSNHLPACLLWANQLLFPVLWVLPLSGSKHSNKWNVRLNRQHKRRPNKPAGLTLPAFIHVNIKVKDLGAFICSDSFLLSFSFQQVRLSFSSSVEPSTSYRTTERTSCQLTSLPVHCLCVCESSTVWRVFNIKKSWGWRRNHTQTQVQTIYFFMIFFY